MPNQSFSRSGASRKPSTQAIAKPEVSEPTVKFVDHTPITRPRSCLWNQPAIVPTLPDQPVACARPLTATQADHHRGARA